MGNLSIPVRIGLIIALLIGWWLFMTWSSNFGLESGQKLLNQQSQAADVARKVLDNAERQFALDQRKNGSALASLPVANAGTPQTYVSVAGLPFSVNGVTSDRPAARILLSGVPKGVTGAYKLVLEGAPDVAVWSPAWSTQPSPDVDAFLRQVSVESPRWILVYTQGQVNFDM